MHAYQPERLNAENSSNNAAVAALTAHPALCAGAAVSLVAICAIFVNAVWYQPGKHPSPLFATRALETAEPLTVKTVKTEIVPAASKRAPVKTVAVEASDELLREVQTALSVRGYYTGKLDGVYGSRTKKAISTFQKDHSLQADGQPSVRLLTQVLMSASSRPQEVPVPSKRQLANNTVKVKTVSVDSNRTETTSSNKQEEVLDGVVARIQSGLRAYGYDDLVVDGKMGQQTATAIQRFQLDYGMKITGEPSDSVLKKLREIGAYTQG